jgi:hypothetical protein
MNTTRKITKEVCFEKQLNRAVPDFACDLLFGHGGPHKDPATSTRWNFRVPPFKRMRRQSSYHLNKKVTRRNG